MRLASFTRTASALALSLGLAGFGLPALADTAAPIAPSGVEMVLLAQAGTAGDETASDAAPAGIPQPKPRVIWRDAPRVWSRSAPAPTFDAEPGFDARLDAARRQLDDSAAFPPAGGSWYYDADSGTYYVQRGGQWYVYGERRGWYDEHGNYIPEGWNDGRVRRGDPHRWHWYRGPCGCSGW